MKRARLRIGHDRKGGDHREKDLGQRIYALPDTTRRAIIDNNFILPRGWGGTISRWFSVGFGGFWCVWSRRGRGRGAPPSYLRASRYAISSDVIANRLPDFREGHKVANEKRFNGPTTPVVMASLRFYVAVDHRKHKLAA